MNCFVKQLEENAKIELIEENNLIITASKSEDLEEDSRFSILSKRLFISLEISLD